MYKGGAGYTTASANIIRYTGLFVPIILVAYGFMLRFIGIEGRQSVEEFWLILIGFWWIYMGIIQFLFRSKTARESALRLIAYHLLAGAYLMFISGVASPFAVFWLLLVMASFTYFHKTGVLLSISSFALVALADALLWGSYVPNIVNDNLIILITVMITGIIFLSISKAQTVSKTALQRSRKNESISRDRVLTIVNNLTDAVFSTDSRGLVKVYNAAALGLIDTNTSPNGTHIDDLLPLIDQEQSPVSIFEAIKHSKATVKRDDLSFVIDGEEDPLRLELTYAPIRSSYNPDSKSETHEGYIIILRDITKEKSLEEEKDEFISVVSHELRTPVAIAEGTLSNALAVLDRPKATKKLLKQTVTLAHDQIIFLAQMVNDLSTLSRAERGVGETAEEIDIRELLHILFDKYQPQAKQKGLSLNLDLPSTLGSVLVSRLYLEELLQNLVTNAIKYTNEGHVSLRITQKEGEAIFAIIDTGIGISKADQAHVFKKFYRSEDYRTRETGGSGLGLYIASKLARKLGTKIQLTSRLNHGSTFSFALPVHTVKVDHKKTSR